MVVWKGLGILALIIPIGFAIIFYLLFGDDMLYLGAGYSIGAILVWFVGKWLNKDSERIETDPKTGQQTILKMVHSMFWIRMELWAPIMLFIGVLVAIRDLTKGISEQFIIPAIGVFILFNIFYKFYNKGKKKDLVHNTHPIVQKNSSTDINKISKLQTKPSKKSNNFNKKKSTGIDKRKEQNLTQEQKEKKEFYNELRNSRKNLTEFEKSDHSNYMPKKTNSEQV